MNIYKKPLMEMITIAREDIFKKYNINFKFQAKKILNLLIPKKNIFKTNEFFWPKSLLAMSLEQSYICEKNKKDLDILENYYCSWIKKGLKINYIDQSLNGYIMLFLYDLTKNEKYKKSLHSIFEYLFNYQKKHNNSFPYRESKENIVLIDSVGMICPFLCRYGKYFKNKLAIDLAINHIINYFKKGFDSVTNLPYHGYDLSNCNKLGIRGWGRGIGWFLMGISYSLEYIPKNHKKYAFIKKKFKELIKEIIKYQNEDGSFSWQIIDLKGHADTSAVSMIFCAIQKVINLKILSKSYEKNCIKAFKYILSFKIKGRIFNCSTECKGINNYPQIYGSYYWSQGPSIMLGLLIFG